MHLEGLKRCERVIAGLREVGLAALKQSVELVIEMDMYTWERDGSLKRFNNINTLFCLRTCRLVLDIEWDNFSMRPQIQDSWTLTSVAVMMPAIRYKRVWASSLLAIGLTTLFLQNAFHWPIFLRNWGEFLMAIQIEKMFDFPGPLPNGMQATEEGLWVLD